MPVSQNLAQGTNAIRGTSERKISFLDPPLERPEKFVNYFVDCEIKNLHHRYFALRHGQSLANVAGLIASDPEVACKKYGLSDLGKEQARSAGIDLVERFLETRRLSANNEDVVRPQGIWIISSDFLRAKETADIVLDTVRNSGIEYYLNGDKVFTDPRLRERYFGEWDLKSDVHYADVWKDDAIDPLHEKNDVESVWSVVDRTTQCICDWDIRRIGPLEDEEDGYRPLEGQLWVILVAHGDVLQILQTAFNKTDPSKHRSLEHLETATLRPLHLSK